MAHPQITKLHSSLGAEVAGVDLGKPDEPTGQMLSRALADHLALVFHDQSLTPAQYLAAASVFGPPMEQHYSQHNRPNFSMIGLVWHRNGQRPAEQWHTDHANRERPRPRPSCTESRSRRRAVGRAWRTCARRMRRYRKMSVGVSSR
jgi:alpha-ketoglutarate-dependent taurine dioxygenase